METLAYILEKYGLAPKEGDQMPFEIPNVGRYQLAELFAEVKFGVGAEIGVFRAKYAKVLTDANPDCKLFLVDPWAPYAKPSVFWTA